MFTFYKIRYEFLIFNTKREKIFMNCKYDDRMNRKIISFKNTLVVKERKLNYNKIWSIRRKSFFNLHLIYT